MSHHKDDYLKTIQTILADQLGIDETDILPDKDICQDLGADSLDQVDMVCAFEEEYDIEVSDNDADQWRKVSDIVAYLERTLGPSKTSAEASGE